VPRPEKTVWMTSLKVSLTSSFASLSMSVMPLSASVPYSVSVPAQNEAEAF
jgi:hypothetical protein